MKNRVASFVSGATNHCTVVQLVDELNSRVEFEWRIGYRIKNC